jgi:hypothetical protein
MKKRLLIPALLFSFAASGLTAYGQAVSGQTASGQAPKVLKDSGIKKLSVFLGTWRAENSPDTGGNVNTSAVYTCQMSAYGNYLIADQRVTSNGKTTNNLSIYSYDPVKDTYLLSLVGVPGMQPFSIPVTYKGDELYYLNEYMDNGKKVYGRTVNIFLSPTSYIFKVQSSRDGVVWITSMEGKATKIPSPGAMR